MIKNESIKVLFDDFDIVKSWKVMKKLILLNLIKKILSQEINVNIFTKVWKIIFSEIKRIKTKTTAHIFFMKPYTRVRDFCTQP